MKRYVIERNIPGVGAMSGAELSGAATQSCRALLEGGPDVQWQHSYVAGDRTFCIYLAKGEEAIRRHAEVSGFPADRIVEIATIIDPTTAAMS